jgi:DNA-binding MarR family transcriptional regulator
MNDFSSFARQERMRDRLGELQQYISSGQPDLTNRQQAIALSLALNGRQTIRGLAKQMGVAKPIVTRAVTTLSGHGLARRTVDEHDRRSLWIEPGDGLSDFLAASGLA